MEVWANLILLTLFLAMLFLLTVKGLPPITCSKCGGRMKKTGDTKSIYDSAEEYEVYVCEDCGHEIYIKKEK